MPIQPLYDNVVVRLMDAQQTTSSGILIAPITQSHDRAEVVAVGEGHLLQDGNIAPSTVKVGDIVILGNRGGQTIKVDGEDLVVFRESELLGIIS